VLGGFENDPGPNGIETALAFDFGKIAVTVQPPTQNGRPGVPQTSELGVAGAATDAVASEIAASAVSTTQVSLAAAATPVPANSPLHYFLKVNGATGDATLKGFEGWFAVDGFDWGAQNTTSVGSATGGGAGKTTFSPLTVDIHSLSGLATLFGDAARGESLGTVELAAVDTVRGGSLKVYDIKLSDVLLSGFENDPGPNGIETALAFDFGKIAVTVAPPTQNGRPGLAQTAGFDLSPNDLVFDPATSGPGAIQGALLAPGTIGSAMPDDLTWRPTLSAQS
jgi:type VI secretion system secreted protein Hcp